MSQLSDHISEEMLKNMRANLDDWQKLADEVGLTIEELNQKISELNS